MVLRKKKTIGICAVKTPFMKGGAEILCSELALNLDERGYDVDILEVPFSPWPSSAVLSNAAAWRLLEPTAPDGHPIDLLITTKFPSYLIRHQNKVAWLFHQMRELFDPNVANGYFNESLSDEVIRERLIEVDKTALAEHKALFTISRNVGTRLKKYHDLTAETIYPPPKMIGHYKRGKFGDYFLSVGRLDPWKRADLLIEALAVAKTPAKGVIVGKGPEEKRLKNRVKELGLTDRVSFFENVEDKRLIDLYASARGIYFCPRDEDYGFITIEAFLSAKPVITANDAGGPLEFVKDNKTGFVVAPQPKEIARVIDRLMENDKIAEELGSAANESLPSLSWDDVIHRLVEPFL
jgi:glycosyltransferase involved in cell wall biosynthesis